MRLVAALDRFVVQLQADGRSPYTIDQYRRHVLLLDAWLAGQRRRRELASINHETLAHFLNSDVARKRADGTPKKATSTNTLRTSLRMFFGYAHAAGWAPRDAAALVRRARCASPPPRGISEADSRRLLETLAKETAAAARRDHMLFHLLLGTGIRIGSAMGLTTEDIDLGGAELRLRTMKGDRPETLPVSPAVCRHLREYMAGIAPGPLFPGPSGRPLARRHVQRRLAEWAAKAGIAGGVNCHQFRHGFAMRLYEQTSDIALVGAALRHRSVQSTLRYAGASRDRVRAAVAEAY